MIHSNQVAMRKIVSTCMCLVFLIGMVAYFPQISEGKEAGSILPPPDGGGNVLAGEGGGGDPPFPPGFTPVKHPEPSLLNETSDENNSWPDVGDQWVSNGTRPLSDLVPMNSSGYPNPVEGGENTTLKSRIKNIGYAFLSSTELAFYDGVVSNGTLIGKREVNLYSGEGEADILWSVSAFGNHTVIVVADPDDDEEELNETNNMISFNLEVIYGPLPGPIDLSITTEAVESGDLIQVNSSASVNITVTNIDSGIATNIDVRVIERPLNSTVANYTIDSLEAYSSHTQTINWTPQVNATNYLEVILDENNSLNDSLNERNESNNVASAGFFVLPWIEEWDPPGPQDCENGFVLFPGDLVVPNGTTRILYNCLIVVRGNVLVSGTLILIDSVLIMFALTPNDFVVFQGGTLSANVGTITSLAQSVGFNFHLSYGSTIALSELTVQWVTGEKDYDSPSGIRVYTDSLTFQDVAIRESMYHGLYVNESAGGAIISGLTIPNSGYSGIFLSSNSSAIVRNNVLDENLDGIYLSNTNSDSEVQGNDITNNMRFGILASSAATEIHNNTIEFNGLGFWYYYGSGIDIHSSSSLIHNNTILHNRNGIVVKGNTSNVVQDNNISENFFAGLYFLDIVSDGFPIVENNTGISFNLYGIIDVRTSAFIENNTLEENYVAVYTRTSTSNYTLNSFVGNKFSVLSFGWSSISVYDNSFSRGSISYAIYGIYSMASFLQIIENDFEDLEISVWERGSSSTIRMNDLDGSYHSWRVGVRIYGSTTSILSNKFLSYYDWRGKATAIEVLDQSYPLVWRNEFTPSTRSIYLSYSGGVIEENSGYVRNYPWPSNETGTRPCGGVGYYIYHSIEPLEIRGNWINYTGYSIYLISSSPHVENNYILHDFYPPGFVFNDYKDGPGVSWDEINRCAICVYQNSSPFIANNTLIGNSYGISIEGIRGKIARPTIFNNTIEKTGWMAISSSGRSPEYPANSEPNIIENTIRNSTGAAIFVADDGWANITGNVIEGSHGLTLKKPDTSNETEKSYKSAITIGVWSPPFPGNKTGTGEKHVSGNVIAFGNHSSGVFIFWTPVTGLRVTGNTISEFPTGIYVDKRPDYHLIENNTISGIQEGIRIQSPASPNLWNNTIWNTTKGDSKGIAFYSHRDEYDDYTLQNNNSINNTMYGIFLHDTGNKVNLKDIDWIHNTSYAIYSDMSIPKIEGVDINHNPEGFGLFAVHSSPDVRDDSVFRDNLHGAYIFETFAVPSGKFPRISDSKFESNSENGIILNSTTVYIDYANASHNNLSGILAYGGEYGGSVTLDLDESNITENTVGLYMFGAGDNQPISHNNISENQWGAYVHSTSPHISHNDFLNNTHSSLYLYLNSAPNVEWNLFSNSAIHPEERYGINVEDCSHEDRDLYLSNNTFSYVNESLVIKNSGRDNRIIRIRDNKFRHATNSIRIHNSGKSGNPLLVQYNNVTRNLGGKAIGIYSSITDVEVLVESNSLWNVSVGVYIQSPWVTVEKNTISVWGWEPTPIDSGPRGIYSSSPTTIIGNNTLDTISKKFGWTEVNGIRGTWRLAYNNTVRGYVYGFRVSSTTNSTMKQNHIEGNSAGVRLWGSGVSPLIENNTFVNNVDGVLVQGGASPTILNNTMNNSGYFTAGVEVSYGTPTIEGNSIQNIGKFGIWVRSQYGNPEILLNTISYNDYGIKIEGGNATIHSSNNIHHNDYGIYLDTSSGPQIDNNTIENNNDYGIYVYNASLTYLNIRWNNVENNTDGVGDDYGIYGTYLTGPSYWYCECNWWGDNSGPFDNSTDPPHYNPLGQGDKVSDWIEYVNWTVVVGGNRVCEGSP